MRTERPPETLPIFDLELDLLDKASPYTARFQQPEASARFGETLVDPATGEIRSYASLIDPVLKAQAQLEANLQHYSTRAQIRRMIADKIEREVAPIMPLPWIQKIPEKLRQARRTGTYGIHAESHKGIILWDDKASLSRLCPDDAREEASRLQKRYLPAIEEAWRDGCHVQYAVFTMPNFSRGDLAAGMKKICNRFRDLIKRKDADGNRVFPEIEGALTVLEAPLAWDRSWNVHLNVMLVVRGFCDYAKLRRLWHWDVQFQKLPTGDVEHLRKSFRELIKYAVQATGEKSQHHADVYASRDANNDANTSTEPGTRACAPPMLAWTGQELAEWLLAMHGFRRTRSYGCLYGAPKAEPASLDAFVWVGYVRQQNGRYVCRVRLLDSVPEDKSGVTDPRDRWEKYLTRVRPPPDAQPAGLGRAAQPLENLVEA